MLRMASGSFYGNEIGEAHRIGDLHIHGFDIAGGYWVSWDSPTIKGDAAGFVSRASREWHGFQRLSGFEKQLSGGTKSLKSFLKVETKMLLGFDEQMREDNALEEAFFSLRSSKKCNIVPLVTFTEEYDWKIEGDLPIFEAVNDLCSPVFLKKGDSNDPWTSIGVNTGVLAMVALNLPRAAYESKDEDSFFDRVAELTELAANGMEARRAQLEKDLANGALPFTSSMVDSFEGFYCSVGVVGVNEALQNMVDRGIGSMQGKAIAYKTMELIKRVLKDRDGHFCLSAEPSGSAPYRLAQLDRERHPEIKARGVNAPFYTNSTCLPVDYTDDLWDALEHQKKLQMLYGGGSLFNIALSKGIDDACGCKLLVRRILENVGVPCIAFSLPVSVEGMGGFERLGYWYRPVSDLSAGEMEEVGICRPYAVASGW